MVHALHSKTKRNFEDKNVKNLSNIAMLTNDRQYKSCFSVVVFFCCFFVFFCFFGGGGSGGVEDSGM